ncbi:MAG TPA: hypothetical protein DCZ75_05330 [Geobacter sp.]|nr:hypothetical protein [Geobacter sp.]
MTGPGTLQLRLSGESRMIATIFTGLQERMPRGPRGGTLYRLSLKENTDGVSSRLYCDLPLSVFADLFPGAAAARPQKPANPVLVAPGTASPAGTAQGGRSRYDIGYNIRQQGADPMEAP